MPHTKLIYWFEELGEEFNDISDKPVSITELGDFVTNILKAKSILYLLDNAGEVGFDSLVIEELKNNNSKVYLVCKNDYFFDDATLKDIEYFGIDKLVQDIIVSDGIFLPEQAKYQTKQLLEEIDIIISKGTGNYEAFKDESINKNIIFALKIKCERLSNYYKTPIGTYIVDATNEINSKISE